MVDKYDEDDEPVKRGRGRPFGSKSKAQSKLRKTLGEFHKREEAALMVIDKIMIAKKEIELTQTEKLQLDTAKFIVKTIESLNETCLREEAAILRVKAKNEEAGEALEEAQSTAPSNFSMDMPSTIN